MSCVKVERSAVPTVCMIAPSKTTKIGGICILEAKRLERADPTETQMAKGINLIPASLADLPFTV